MSKACSHCGKIKDKSEFHINTSKVSGLSNYCKTCTKLVNKTGIRHRAKSDIHILPDTKRCYKCKQIKNKSEFSIDSSRLDGLANSCTACKKKSYKKLNERDYNLRSKYGINEAQYNKLYEDQSNKCAICEKVIPVLSVDHCHITNKIRGLLCSRCNSLLGFCDDNINILKNAITYLEDSHCLS